MPEPDKTQLGQHQQPLFKIHCQVSLVYQSAARGAEQVTSKAAGAALGAAA